MASPFTDRAASTGAWGARSEEPAPPNLTHLRADSPFRPVDWRWQKARLLRISERKPSRLVDDAATVAALEFQEAHALCKDPWDYLALHEDHPDLAQAYELATGTDHVEYTRWELEARLLAPNGNLDETAVRTNLRTGAVEWYEKLFFSVLDRLHSPGYLINYAIGHRIHTSLTEADVGMIWKLAGLCGGIVVLEDMMQVMSPSVLDDPALLPKYYRDQSRDIVGRRATVAALTFRARDPMFKVQLMELNAKYTELEATLTGGGSGDDRTLDGLRMLLESVKFIVTAVGTERAPLPPGRRPLISVNGAEMRSEHLLLAAAGQPVILPDGFDTAKFPEPRLPTDLDTPVDPIDDDEVFDIGK